MQETEKYPSTNSTNPDINNTKFNNFEKMFKERTAIDFDTLDNYCPKNIDKMQREYSLLSSFNSIKNSLQHNTANGYFIGTFRYFFYYSKFAQYDQKKKKRNKTNKRNKKNTTMMWYVYTHN